MAKAKVVGVCVCPICYDLHDVENNKWRSDIHRAKIHAPPSKPYMEIHCPHCQSKLRGRALWLWINNPPAQTHFDERSLPPEKRKQRAKEDVQWTTVRAAQDHEMFVRLRYAGLRPQDDLWCPVCQRLPTSKNDGPSLWLSHDRSSDNVGKCRRCMTLYYGTDEIITWRKRQSLSRKELSEHDREHTTNRDHNRTSEPSDTRRDHCERADGGVGDQRPQEPRESTD